MRWLAILCVPAVLVAQRSDTIYASPLRNVTSAPTYSAPIRNIGQSGHLIWVQLSNKTPQVCTAPAAVNIGLEASFDGARWSPVGSTISSVSADANGNLIATATAQGAYAYIRAAVRALPASCRADVAYSGTIGGQGIVDLSSGDAGALPQHVAFPPTTIVYDFSSTLSSCFTVLQTNNESGVLNHLAIRALNNAELTGSAYIDVEIDNLGAVPIVPLFTGTEWSLPMRAHGSGLTVTQNTGAVIGLDSDYRATARVRLCPGDPGPVGSLMLAISVLRRVHVH